MWSGHLLYQHLYPRGWGASTPSSSQQHQVHMQLVRGIPCGGSASGPGGRMGRQMATKTSHPPQDRPRKSSAAPGVATTGADHRGQTSGWASCPASHTHWPWFIEVPVRLGQKEGSCNQNQSLEPTAVKSQDPLPLLMDIWAGLPVSLWPQPGALYLVSSATPQGCPTWPSCPFPELLVSSEFLAPSQRGV